MGMARQRTCRYQGKTDIKGRPTEISSGDKKLQYQGTLRVVSAKARKAVIHEMGSYSPESAFSGMVGLGQTEWIATTLPMVKMTWTNWRGLPEDQKPTPEKVYIQRAEGQDSTRLRKP